MKKHLVFFIFIFFKNVLYKNIFYVSYFTVLYPYRPAEGGRDLHINKYNFFFARRPLAGGCRPSTYKYIGRCVVHNYMRRILVGGADRSVGFPEGPGSAAAVGTESCGHFL